MTRTSQVLLTSGLIALRLIGELRPAEAFSPEHPRGFRFRSSRASFSTAVAAAAGGAGPRGDPSSARKSPGRRSASSRPGSRPRGVRLPPKQQVATRRAPHQYDHTKDVARPFVDVSAEIAGQVSNEGAAPYDLLGGGDGASEGLRCLSSGATNGSAERGDVVKDPHFQSVSLDELFPGLDFSQRFSSDGEFRKCLRDAMREDIFETTPAYRDMSEKAKRMLLLPDSSLQGSWRCLGGKWLGSEEGDRRTRMKKLTQVLREYLGDNAPSGDDFMDIIGALCGPGTSAHWIDIVGVTNRRITHSWHQDTGQSPGGNTNTVLMGFPREDDYYGVGVFSHILKIKTEMWSSEGHPPNEPVIYAGDIPEKYIVRPQFAMGKEIIMYRDIDVLHSSPDVAYRMSVMRFM